MGLGVGQHALCFRAAKSARRRLPPSGATALICLGTPSWEHDSVVITAPPTTAPRTRVTGLHISPEWEWAHYSALQKLTAACTQSAQHDGLHRRDDRQRGPALRPDLGGAADRAGQRARSGGHDQVRCSAARRGCSLRRCSLFRRLFRFLRLLFVPSRSLSPASGSAARVASGSFSPCFAAHTLLLRRAECRPCAGGWTRS